MLNARCSRGSPAVGACRPPRSRSREQHRHRHLHLHQREIAAGADARPGAERHRDPLGRRQRGGRRTGEPALRLERGGFGEVAVVERIAPHQAEDHRLGRHLDAGDVVSRDRLHRQDRRHRLQAHRLARAGLDVVERADRSACSAAGRAPRASPRRARAARRPDARCSRWISQASVFAVVSSPASSIVEHVAGDVAIVEAAAAFVGRGDHRLEQVARMLAALRLRLHPLARLGDEALDRRAHRAHAAVERAVRGQPDIAPVAAPAPACAGTAPGRSGPGGAGSRRRRTRSVLTSEPNARPAIASTVKRIRSACRSIRRAGLAACCQRPCRRCATRSSDGK